METEKMCTHFDWLICSVLKYCVVHKLHEGTSLGSFLELHAAWELSWSCDVNTAEARVHCKLVPEGKNLQENMVLR